MNRLRHCVPVLGIIALAALFFKLPEAPNIFGICKACSSSGPYLPLIGAGYFALLVSVSLLFPAFPKPLIARGGLLWAMLLALVLTTISPGWCPACLIAHGCNILIWTIWVIVPVSLRKSKGAVGEKAFLMLLAPISTIALFSCLNLTFMAYGSHYKISGLQRGDTAPSFSVQIAGTSRLFANTDSAVINFVSPDCPYCQEQLLVLSEVAVQLASGSYRFINISPKLSPELLQSSPGTEWVEDKEGSCGICSKCRGIRRCLCWKMARLCKPLPGFPKS